MRHPLPRARKTDKPAQRRIIVFVAPQSKEFDFRLVAAQGPRDKVRARGKRWRRTGDHNPASKTNQRKEILAIQTKGINDRIPAALPESFNHHPLTRRVAPGEETLGSDILPRKGSFIGELMIFR